ncbi:hypothetical protein, partial [Aquitalea sp. LB_tupeE]|uniref:hypothetical protein n=1 Tax=Aquitalea sp. LB_tupeE TaxID=2748078 RepID=UPI001C4C016B
MVETKTALGSGYYHEQRSVLPLLHHSRAHMRTSCFFKINDLGVLLANNANYYAQSVDEGGAVTYSS